jgi:hypothetical protein
MPVSLDQKSYRFRNDDGGEAAATWIAAINTAISLAEDANFRLRFEIQETGGTEATLLADRQSKLQYRKNGGAWNDVDGTSLNIRSALSTHFADADPTTNQLTAGTGTFTAGTIREGQTATTVDPSIPASGHTEHEYMLNLRGVDVDPSDVIDLRIVRLNGNPLDTYTQTAQLTVAGVGGGTPVLDQKAYRFRNDDGSESAATWKAAQNTNVTLSEDATFRLRFEVQETAGNPASTFDHRQYKLQHRRNNGTWDDTGPSSLVIRTIASTHVVPDEATTNQLTAGTGTFSAGAVDEDDGALTVASIAASGHTEVEFVLILRGADVEGADTIQLRLRRLSGNPLDTYTQTPTVTVESAAPPPPAAFVFGVGTGYPRSEWSAAYRNDYYQRIYNDGFRKVRFDINNVPGTGDGTMIQGHVNSALAAGLQIMGMIDDHPTWGSATDYLNRAQAVADFYKLQITEWELMNEPNLDWADGGTYAARAKPAALAIKAVYSGASLPAPKIILGGSSPFGSLPGTDPRSPDVWLEAVYDWSEVNGNNTWFDEVHHHPYGYQRNLTGAQAFAVNGGWNVLQALRDIMVAHGDSAKKIGIGEHGAPTWSDGIHTTDNWTPAGTAGDPNNPLHAGMDEQAQADLFDLSLDDWKLKSWAGDFYIYSYRDNAPERSSDLFTREGHFGIVYNNYDPKPARSVLLSHMGAPENTTLPSISGSALVGQTLTANNGVWTNSPTGFTYQWKRDGVAIAGATSQTYQVTASDYQKKLSVTVTATNASGSGAATSAETATVAYGTPTIQTAPQISGVAAVGSTLSCSTGVWSNVPTAYVYQWRVSTDGSSWTNIVGATSPTYLVLPTDQGKYLSCLVTASNPG